MERQEIPRGKARVAAWAMRLSGWPRVVRILICGAIALLSAVVTSQLVAAFMNFAVLQDASAANTLLFISIGAGFVAYMIGWWLLVGFDREQHPELGSGAVFFVIYGILIAVILIGWILVRTLVAYLPPEIPI